jgi:hypothetical protein
VIVDVKTSELSQITRWDSGPSSSGTDYYILYSYSKMEDVLFLNSFGSMMGWEYDHWYNISSKDLPPTIIEIFVSGQWNEEKQKMLNSIPKTGIKTPD